MFKLVECYFPLELIPALSVFKGKNFFTIKIAINVFLHILKLGRALEGGQVEFAKYLISRVFLFFVLFRATAAQLSTESVSKLLSEEPSSQVCVI